MLDAHDVEHDKRIRLEAQWIAHLMNATGNYAENPVTVTKLLGETKNEHDANSEKMQQLQARAEARKAERLKQRESRG